MLHCQPKQPAACIRYDANGQTELNEFLIENGGKEARFDVGGIAHVSCIVKGEQRFVYLNPGSWLRAVGYHQFSACSHAHFIRSFNLINNDSQVDEVALEESIEKANESMAVLRKITINELSGIQKALNLIRGKKTA